MVAWEATGLVPQDMIFLHTIWRKNILKALTLRSLGDLVYSGKLRLTDMKRSLKIDAGKLVLSTTRTYAPVIKKVLESMRKDIHGMVHCSEESEQKLCTLLIIFML